VKPFHVILCLFPLLDGNAQAGDWRVGLGLGTARGDSGIGDLSDRLREHGLDARAISSDDDRFAWRLRLGYTFTPRWGVEAAYVDLGDVEATFTSSTEDIDTFLSLSVDVHPNTADGFLVSGVYRHALGNYLPLQAVARAGAFVWSSEYDLNCLTRSRKVKENGTDLSFGLGVELGLENFGALPPGMALGLDWQRFKIDDEGIDLFSLGLSYRFHPSLVSNRSIQSPSP